MEPTPCIRCGTCVDVCPEHLVPQMMMDAAERHDMEKFQKLKRYGMRGMRLLCIYLPGQETADTGIQRDA